MMLIYLSADLCHRSHREKYGVIVMKVSLFITCLCDFLTPEVGKDTVEVLERFGCEVDFPTAQTCCGQPAFNSGHLDQAKKAMKQMIRTFEEADYVVAPSGSCIGMLKQYPKVFADDPKWELKAQDLADKSYEICQFLVNVIQVIDVQSKFQGKVTYHPSCHMTRILGETEATQKLLQNIRGVEIIDLPLKESCCGFGGTFAIDQADISQEMVQEKVASVEKTKADYLIGADMACLLNIQGRMQRENSTIKVKHITHLLNDT